MRDLKTGRTVDYTVWNGEPIFLVEWKCPECKHRWFEYSDEQEYPEVCPLCGSGLREEED